MAQTRAQNQPRQTIEKIENDTVSSSSEEQRSKQIRADLAVDQT